MAKSMDDATATMVANLQAKTGKSLQLWTAIVEGWSAGSLVAGVRNCVKPRERGEPTASGRR